jgi:hypothetical protein
MSAPRRRWTEDAVQAELAVLLAETGRMPTRAELTDRGLRGLWNAMSRLGGVAAWRERMGVARRSGILVPKFIVPPREQIAVAAYFRYQAGQPGGPVAHWLDAERALTARG